jgi:hypothetical protein
MTEANDTREQGIEFGPLAEEPENEYYPMAKAELLERHGDETLEFSSGDSKLREVLDTDSEREFEDADSVRQSIFAMVEDDAVGREEYSDRGGSTPDDAVDDEEEAKEKAKDLEAVVETHADAPTTPRALVEDMLSALDSPAYGPMEFDQHDRPERMDELSETFEEAESLLDAEFEDVIDEDVERGFY